MSLGPDDNSPQLGGQNETNDSPMLGSNRRVDISALIEEFSKPSIFNTIRVRDYLVEQGPLGVKACIEIANIQPNEAMPIGEARERAISTLGFIGEALDPKKYPHDILDICNSLANIIRTEWRLGVLMTTVHAFTRLKTVPALDSQTSLIRDLLQRNDTIQSDYARQYVFRNDWIENLLEAIQDSADNSTRSLLQEIIENPDSNNQFRPRIRMKAQGILQRLDEQNHS